MMTTLLSDKQLKSITGGALETPSWFCTAFLPSGNVDYIVPAGSATEAADKVHAMTGASQVNCTKHSSGLPTE